MRNIAKMNRIGLKYNLKKNKDMSWRYWLHTVYWELRYAWQRAWRGYDATEIFNMDDSFVYRIVPMLEDFKKYNECLFVDPDTHRILSAAETDKVINDLIKYACNMDEEYILEQKYGKQWYDYEYEVNELTETVKENKKKFFELFSKHFYSLWY